MFPSGNVELPSAEKFKEFPPEAQQAILAAFQREQTERHGWLKNQQSYDFRLNNQAQGHYFIWRMTGTVSGAVISLTALIVGAWLIKAGSSWIGATAMLAAFAGLYGGLWTPRPIGIHNKLYKSATGRGGLDDAIRNDGFTLGPIPKK